MPLKSPEDVAKDVLHTLPNWLASLLWNAGIAFAWYGLVSSIFGLFQSLQFLVNFLRSLAVAYPQLMEILTPVGVLVISALELYRTITTPIRLIFDQVLPFDLSESTKDFIIVGLMTLPALVRVVLVSTILRNARDEMEANILSLEKSKVELRSANQTLEKSAALGAALGGGSFLTGMALGGPLGAVIGLVAGIGVQLATSASDKSKSDALGNRERRLAIEIAVLKLKLARYDRRYSHSLILLIWTVATGVMLVIASVLEAPV